MVRNGRLLTCARVIGVTLGVHIAFAQKCYYPNGEEAAGSEKPCSSAEGSACCPEKWECLDNGMCYYPANKIYGRYSCTDQKWEADGCPSNLCTYDKTAFGAENMQQCSGHNNQWCCNADNVHVDCCKESPEPRPFFDLKDGTAYATIGGNSPNQVPILATITGLATGSGGSSPSATNSAPSSGQSEPSSASKEGSPAPTGPSTPVTSLETRVSSGTAGIVTQVITSVISPSAETGNPSPTSSSSSSKLPLIVGLAVGIPLALALAGIIFWLLRKRSQQKKQTAAFPESPNPYSNGAQTPDFAGGAKLHKHSGSTGEYESKTDVPELAGQSVGPGRPVSNIQGKAELDSGHGFAPGAVAHAPHLVGLGGGSGHTPQASSWGSAPPGYSPGMNTNAWTPAGTNGVPPGVVEADDTAVRPGTGGVAGAAAPTAGAATTEGGRYIPYRPPPGHGQTGLHNGPAVAEMNAVTTPPATELSAVRTPPA